MNFGISRNRAGSILLASVLALGAHGACAHDDGIGIHVQALEGSPCCNENDNPAPLSFSGSFAAKGDVKSDVQKGTVMVGGEERTTNAGQLKSAQDHAKRYDGAATYNVHYSITLKADKSVDTAASTVTFKKVTYTSSGTKTTTTFETVAIPITGVTLGPCDVLESFTFKGDTWYKNIPAGIVDKGISGTANLKTSEASYTAKYQDKDNGASYTYTATGVAPKKECPVPEPQCCIDDSAPDGDGLPRAQACVLAVDEPCEEPPAPVEPDPAPPGEYDIYEPMHSSGGGGGSGSGTPTVTITSDWGTGYCATLTVANTTSSPITWQVAFTVRGTITNMWAGTFTQSGATATVSGVSWNAVLQPGQSTSGVGFCAQG
jgi:cellulase/cellobiase CelA1